MEALGLCNHHRRVLLQTQRKHTELAVKQQFQWVDRQRESPGSWLPVRDNALFHRSNAVMECFSNFKHDVETPDWPPYSPDLNPIENTWADIKKRVYKRGGQRPGTFLNWIPSSTLLGGGSQLPNTAKRISRHCEPTQLGWWRVMVTPYRSDAVTD